MSIQYGFQITKKIRKALHATTPVLEILCHFIMSYFLTVVELIPVLKGCHKSFVLSNACL